MLSVGKLIASIPRGIFKMIRHSSSKTPFGHLMALWGMIFVIFGQEMTPTRAVGGSEAVACFDSQLQPGGRKGKLRIRSGKRVDRLQLVCELRDGRTMTGPPHAGKRGTLERHPSRFG
jgi:hypothetical protein